MAMNNLQVLIKYISKTAKMPEKMSECAAGYDIFADIESDIVMKPMQRVLIPTGFSLAIPPQHEAQVRPRSGLALKHGITVLNSPGTIDADYRGEVKIILINLSNEEFIVQRDMRIAQLIISKHTNVEFEIVEQLDETQRGSGGFGHS